ncbi:hypothetical protein [Actinomadura hibisca]|uniref:hypothetical protein n=1 Tax=Actinomadura hibisca TaxID=68565 RepID=UPI0008321423|nr:hypothetical protein [Actinomadura hibisca]
MVPPDEGVARPVAAVLFLAVAVAHVLTLPDGFGTESYIGVGLLVAILMAVGGAAGMLAETRDRVWWYTVAEGVLNVAGTLYANSRRLPLQEDSDWLNADGLALLFLSAMLTALAAWVLVQRRAERRSFAPPTAAAAGRRLRSAPPQRRPQE